MEYTEEYIGMDKRKTLCDIATSNGYRMLHDDFDESWIAGDEPFGTLTFTDEPAKQNIAEPVMDYKAEILALKEANITLMADIEKLKEAK